MNENFENTLFIGTLLLYFVLNVINSILMITRKRVGLKLLIGILPFALAIPTMFVSIQILKATIEYNKLPFGTDYGGYGTGLAVILGLLMMFFYAVNAIYLIIIVIKNNMQSSK